MLIHPAIKVRHIFRGWLRNSLNDRSIPLTITNDKHIKAKAIN